MSAARTGCIGLTVCTAAIVGGGVVFAGAAEAAPAPANNVVLARHLVQDDGDGQKVVNNKAKVSGGNNAVSANSPTRNMGFQHNSGSNVARQISIQNAMCKRTKNCRITQKFISKRRFVGFSGPALIRKGRLARQSDFRFFWDETRATTIQNPSMTSLSVENP